MLRISDSVRKLLTREHPQTQRLFRDAVARLQAASAVERHKLLKPVSSNKFQAASVRWTMRANHKYRLLLDRDGSDYIVRGFVGRGDQRFYR